MAMTIDFSGTVSPTGERAERRPRLRRVRQPLGWVLPLAALLVAAVLATAGLAPRLSWMLLAALGLLGYAQEFALRRAGTASPLPPLHSAARWGWAMLLTILGLCLVHLIMGAGQVWLGLDWVYIGKNFARDHRHGARTVAGFLALIVAGWGALLLLRRLTPEQNRGLAVAMALGSTVGVVMLALERFLDAPLHSLFSKVHWAAPDIVAINRNMAGMAMVLWPAVAAAACGAMRLKTRRLKRWVGWSVLALALVTIVSSASQSGAIGMVLGGIVFGMALVSRRLAAVAVTLGLLAGTLGVVPFTESAYDRAEMAQTRIATPLGPVKAPPSFVQRVELWHAAIVNVKHHELTGFGIGSADTVMQHVPDPVEFPGKSHANPAHPHNIPLQLLIELGIFGVGAMLAMLLVLTWIAARMPRYAAAAGLATVTAGFAMAYTAYGAWQGWWNSYMFLGTILTVALARALRKPTDAVA